MSSDSATVINYDFQVPEKSSRYLRTFLAYLHALENWDIDATSVCFDDTFVYRILPASLSPQAPVRSKEEHAALLKEAMVLLGGNKFVMTIHEVIESGHKLAVHCSSKSLSARGNPYTNEYSLFIHYVPLPAGVDPYSPLVDGEALPKIALMKEFMDSQFTTTFLETDGAETFLSGGA